MACSFRLLLAFSFPFADFVCFLCLQLYFVFQSTFTLSVGSRLYKTCQHLPQKSDSLSPVFSQNSNFRSKKRSSRLSSFHATCIIVCTLTSYVARIFIASSLSSPSRTTSTSLSVAPPRLCVSRGHVTRARLLQPTLPIVAGRLAELKARLPLSCLQKPSSSHLLLFARAQRLTTSLTEISENNQ